MTTDFPPDPIDRARRLRDMNETVRRRREEFDGGASATHSLMCECIDPSCAEMVQVAAREIAELRAADAAVFVVSPAHVGEFEVVHTLPGSVVVRFAST